jgi:signal transduction histidine kinase
MTDESAALEARIRELREQGVETAERVDLLLEKVRGLVDDPQCGLLLSQEAYDLALRLKYERGEAYALGWLGYSNYMLSNLEQAIDQLTRSEEMFDRMDDIDGKLLVLGGLSMAHRSLGNYDLAFEGAFTGLRLIHARGDKSMEAWWNNGLGGGFHESGDFVRALQYHREALRLFREVGHKIGEARALTGIGTVHVSRNELEEGLRIHLQSLELYREADNRLGEARALNDLGEIYHRQGKLELAVEHHQNSLALREAIGNRQAQCTSLINLGRVELERRDTESALEHLHRALELATEIGSKPRLYQSHEALSQAHALKGEHADALEHHRHFHAIKEEISGDVAASRIKNLEIQFEVEKSQKEAEIERLRSVELKEKNEQLQSLLAELKEMQGRLVHSEKLAALANLVAGVVHELNTPVGALQSSSDLARRCTDVLTAELQTPQGEGDRAAIDRALKSLDEACHVLTQASRRLAKIGGGLKTFARLDEAVYQETDLHSGIESTLALMEHALGDVEVQRDFGDLPRVLCYPTDLNQVFMHLVTNAAQAMRGQGRLTIRTRRTGDRVEVQIRDTGPGIPREQQKTLFEPAFSRQGDRVKAGLGLFTSRDIMARHGGEIRVDSTPGEGSTFTLVLPARRSAAPTEPQA